MESADLRDSWREFQTVGSATQNALYRNFVLVRGTMSLVSVQTGVLTRQRHGVADV